ncbi:hypothetical protein [Dokdonella sp.]|uniref:hypothetical protein n=1 Tax=Dokdonella sp. TaxID=2291710 RepID=UPI002632AC6C|nr:hypothetical protein [Dokdonella sp.]
MKKALLVSALALAGVPSLHAEEWVVEARYPDRAALARVAARFQHVAVDPERRVLRVDTDDAGIRRLEAEGLSVSIDVAATA